MAIPAPKRKRMGQQAQTQKGKPARPSLAKQGERKVQRSYAPKGGQPNAGMSAVTSYYESLGAKAQKREYRSVARNAANHATGPNVAGKLTGVLLQDLSPAAQAAYWKGAGPYAVEGAPNAKAAPWENVDFSGGVASAVKLGEGEGKNKPKGKGKGKKGAGKKGAGANKPLKGGRQANNVRPGYHINQAGKIVKNQGKRKQTKKTGSKGGR